MHPDRGPVRGILAPDGPRCTCSAVLAVVVGAIVCSLTGCTHAGAPGEAAALPAHEQALERAKARIKSEPSSPDAYYALARAYYDIGSKNRALAAVQTAVQLGPERGDLRYATAMLLAELGHHAEAAAEAEAALSHITKPTHRADVYAFLGNRYWDVGDLEGARKSYRAAVKCDPSSPAGLLGLGALAGESGDVKAAKVYFRRALAVAKEPRHKAKAHCGLGKAHEMLGDSAGARRHYKAALAAVPEYGDATEGLKRVGR